MQEKSTSDNKDATPRYGEVSIDVGKAVSVMTVLLVKKGFGEVESAAICKHMIFAINEARAEDARIPYLCDCGKLYMSRAYHEYETSVVNDAEASSDEYIAEHGPFDILVTDLLATFDDLLKSIGGKRLFRG